VKIDRSFTADLTTDEATWSIVRAVIDLSQVLDLTVVAEGVETLAELDQLAALAWIKLRATTSAAHCPKTS